MNSILKVNNLKTYFFTEKQEIKAVDGISFDISKNETLAVVGESGSGKSVTALSIMRLIDFPGKIIEGEISYNNKNLRDLPIKEISKIRGNKISMIHQDPMNSLNPVISVGEQIREVLIIHKTVPKAQAKAKALELMKQVSIPEVELRYNDLPSKFSGGMKQRIMVAMAIACNPEILIADEPTTALDVTKQADILALINKMKSKLGMSVLLITHDLGVVAENADRVIVMYCGQIMEEASVEDLFKKPLHPYTTGLMKCIPRIDAVSDNLYAIPGYIPNAGNYSNGCRFNDRCDKVMDICKKKMPELVETEEGHKVRCWLNHSER